MGGGGSPPTLFKDTGLVDLFMNGTDQYTVFAPANTAFENLVSPGAISDLPAEVVLDVLLYHETEGRRSSNSVVPPKKDRVIETLLGETFSVDWDGMITANNSSAGIMTADISCSNGVVHVITAVLMP